MKWAYCGRRVVVAGWFHTIAIANIHFTESTFSENSSCCVPCLISEINTQIGKAIKTNWTKATCKQFWVKYHSYLLHWILWNLCVCVCVCVTNVAEEWNCSCFFMFYLCVCLKWIWEYCGTGNVHQTESEIGSVWVRPCCNDSLEVLCRSEYEQ